jgi:ElaB/YqjD/DUF883 family membrane-anchored ribosome-binding protein
MSADRRRSTGAEAERLLDVYKELLEHTEERLKTTSDPATETYLRTRRHRYQERLHVLSSALVARSG